MLNTSGCAFSISSRRTTENCLRLTASVSCPPSSNPTYPGGAPTRRDTANFSMYSDMSRRTIAFSSSKSSCASAFASSVLPTPVGPRKRNAPTGRWRFFTPALDLRTASATASTALSCPITRL